MEKQKITIQYKNRILKFNLIYGSLMIGIGIFKILFDATSIFNYGWIVVGLLQVGSYFYDKKYPYLTIEKNTLTRNFLIPKNIKINEIKRVRKFVNSYKIETDTSSMRISKNLIEKNSLEELNHFFNSLRLPIQ